MNTTTNETLAVAGGGAIGCGLAAVAARHGEVLLWTRSHDSAGRAERSLEKACGKIDDGAWADRVRVTTELRDLEEATFVVESIAEELGAKRDLLGRLGTQLRDDAVLATTTSSLPVGPLALASARPERFVGFHVFNPVPKMELVELAFPSEATQETRERARALAARLGKRAVEVPDAPGFVVNRLLFPFLFDAVRFAERTGLTPEEIDACMTLGAGHPMGPLALLDYVGLDVAQAIGEAMDVEVPRTVRELVAEGALGKKAGRGLYDYPA
jgi:3-hydroxybutyryl-CoA dehydrogenase